jgi:hypothetical protein
MQFRPRHRRWIALIALLSLLFQQVAMASYVCPNESGSPGGISTTAKLPPCHAGVATDKARCDQHCSTLPPSSDHPPMPTVPALLPLTVWLQIPQAACMAERVNSASVDARSTAPPLTIQHCTFQI